MIIEKGIYMINKQRLLETFLELVQIDSESGNEQDIQYHLKKIMEQQNIDIYEDKASIQNDTLGANNLICTLKATPNYEHLEKKRP